MMSLTPEVTAVAMKNATIEMTTIIIEHKLKSNGTKTAIKEGLYEVIEPLERVLLAANKKMNSSCEKERLQSET